MILIIDTSLTGIWVGLADQGILLKSDGIMDRNASLNNLEMMIQNLGFNFELLTHILVGKGPGSFTGIKIGLAFSLGVLAVKPDLKLAGVSTLDALSYLKNEVIYYPLTKSHSYKVFKGHHELIEELKEPLSLETMKQSPQALLHYPLISWQSEPIQPYYLRDPAPLEKELK